MNTISNIAGYKFVTLPDVRALRTRLLTLCKAWKLKGTILLSVEGINLFVAGEQEKIDLLLAEIRSLPGLAEFEVKVSEQQINLLPLARDEQIDALDTQKDCALEFPRFAKCEQSCAKRADVRQRHKLVARDV